ncbi:MAG: HEAT repeat domain-containing protein [Deltaproteobacteria bacterium]
MTGRVALSCLLSVSLLAACAFAPARAAAQSKKKSKSAGATPGYPEMSAPPGMGPPMSGGSGYPQGMSGMMGPGMKKPVGKKAPTERTKAAEPVDPEKLPSGYRVPQEPPEALTTTEEWIEYPFPEDKPGSKRFYNATISKYKTIIGAGEFASDADRKQVADIIRYKLSLLTRKENRDKIWFYRNDILTDVKTSPTSRTGSREARKFMLKTIAEEAPRLFKYHAVARINGAILLAELSDPLYNEADGDGNRKAAEPCIRALEPLLELVKDKQQLTAARIWGVIGLVRLGELPELKLPLRNTIVKALVEQLHNSADEHEWYQWRVAEGLGKLNVVYDAEKRAIVPQELAQVLADADRPWLVRAEAALSLGRLQYTSADIDAGLIAYETALLALQTAEAYGKEPERDIWKLYFMKVYGAFKPLDADQKRGLLTQAEKGPLASYKRTVQEAFDVVLPVVRNVVVNSEGMDTSLASLRKWIDSNTPKTFKIHPDEEPIKKIEEPIVKKKPDAVSPAPLDDPPATPGAR